MWLDDTSLSLYVSFQCCKVTVLCGYVAGCQAVIALSHDCSAHQNGLLKESVVPPLVRLLRGSCTKERTLLSVITALASLCIGMPSEQLAQGTWCRVVQGLNQGRLLCPELSDVFEVLYA